MPSSSSTIDAADHDLAEGDAEEEGQPPHAGVAAAPLESLVTGAVEHDTGHEAGRYQDEACHDGIDLEIARQPGTVRGQHQQRRMHHVGDIEQAERDR